MTTILNGGAPVTTLADLNAAILAADGEAASSGAFEIDIGGAISLTDQLLAVNLKAGVSLDIQGGGNVLDGGGSQRGLFVYSGAVTVENLTLQNMLAVGGSGGGGGAGLGGGLFVADDAAHGAAPGAVTLTNVSFLNDAAVGGAGVDNLIGGGGLGGAGGFGVSGGGVGVGVSAGGGFGFYGDASSGGPGVIPFAAGGGSDARGRTPFRWAPTTATA